MPPKKSVRRFLFPLNLTPQAFYCAVVDGFCFLFFLSFFLFLLLLFILLGGLRCQGARKCQKHSGIDTGPPSSRLFANSRMRAWRWFKCRLPLKGLAAKMPRCLHEAALDAVAGHLLRGPRQSAERPARQVKSASQCVQLRRSQRVLCKTHERVPALWACEPTAG